MMMLKIILGIAVVILRRQRYALFLKGHCHQDFTVCWSKLFKYSVFDNKLSL